MARRNRHGIHIEDSFAKATFSLMALLSRYKTLCTVLLIVALAAVIGWFAYRNHLRSYNESALLLFENANSAEDYKSVTEIYPGSDVEPMALFHYGRKLIDSRRYPEAAEVFLSIVEEYPKHFLAPNALVLNGMMLEQQEKFEDAAESYNALIDRYSDSFIVARALLSVGACYEKLGKTEEAKASYEKLIADYPSSSWKLNAEERLNRLGGPVVATEGS